jgi:hypothetical protein
MSQVFIGRVLTLAMMTFVLAVAVSHAATGGEITELTGGALAIFEGLRAADFVRGIGIVLFGFGLFGLMGGLLSAGWAGIIMLLVVLGGWFGAEAIVDTIFTAAAIL